METDFFLLEVLRQLGGTRREENIVVRVKKRNRQPMEIKGVPNRLIALAMVSSILTWEGVEKVEVELEA